MSQSLLALAALIWPPVAVWLILRLFPSSVSKFVEKEIERRSDAKLERLKADLQASYSTLRTSVDVLLASNSGMHPHIIDAATQLWKNMTQMRDAYGALVSFDTILTTKEAEEAFSSKDGGRWARILDMVRGHEGDLPPGSDEYFSPTIEAHRLFCGDRLWLIFYIHRAILARSSLLIALSFKKHLFQDWRADEPISQLFKTVLRVEDVTKARESEFNGLSSLLGKLEAEFLHEATKVMSGSKTMTERLGDMQSLLHLQNAKIAAQTR